MGAKRGGLGRGLGALMPEGALGGGGIEVDIEAISPNPYQPRTTFLEDEIASLAASIAEHGIIQPLLVARAEATDSTPYRIIAGERRWQAARRAGLRQVPVVVKDATPQQMLELALVENIQRADLNPLEEAFAYRTLVAEFGMTQEQVAQRVGKNRTTVANGIRLLGAAPAVQEALAAGQISEGHARALLGLTDHTQQVAALGIVTERAFNVRQTEALVRTWDERPAEPGPAPAPPEIETVQGRIGSALGAQISRVRVKKMRRGYQLTLHVTDDDGLNAIVGRLTR
ncbi:MAG: ParB/RepB/Spo0J family partition protein [Chloroflexota bacterium]|nr:ParB/RepB/Spo0J family partition protein [Chloroflexota bacterium]